MNLPQQQQQQRHLQPGRSCWGHYHQQQQQPRRRHHHHRHHLHNYYNTMLLLLLASSCVLTRSDGAFTTGSTQSSSSSSFLGHALFWGGSAAAPAQSSTATTATTTKQQPQPPSQRNKNKLTCVMQMPPRTTTVNGVPASSSSSSSSASDPQYFNQKSNSNSPKKLPSSPPPPPTTAAAVVPPPKLEQQPQQQQYPVEYVAETKLPTDIGQFQLRAYRVPGAPVGQEPCVIYCRDKPPFGGASNSGNDNPAQNVPVRIHDQCLTSEVFRSQRCDCKEQLHMALKYIQKHGGCIIYLQQEGRGIGLANKIAAYALQDGGLDTVDANLHLGFPEDSREYGIVPGILRDMNIASIQLMTNNPRKVTLLTQHGVTVTKTLPMVVPQANPYNYKYLQTKKTRMHHENLASLLANSEAAAAAAETGQQQQQQQLMMSPQRKSLANQYINNGTEMTANAVQVSLMVDEDEETEVEELVEEQGVVKHKDGWCFGRESVEKAIAAVKRGEMVVVVDDMDRENEGDFIMAAEKCSDLDMAQIVRYSSGVVCVAMEGKRMDELKIPPMVTDNQDPKGTAFGVSVDASKKHGITTGISAGDRAKTAQILADPNSKADDLVRPGHMFPLRAKDGGVLARDGHTEASVDLSRLAGLSPCGILCEIVSEENPTEMMRLPELKRFCKRHGFTMTSIVDIAQYRRETERGQ